MSEEDNLRLLLARARPHPHGLPAEVRPWLLDAAWSRDRLWQMQRPVIELAVAELRWLYELPLWRGADGRWFAVTPAAVVHAPHDHPEHARRIAEADTSFPVHVLRRRGRWVVLDGVHRLLKADVSGAPTVAAVVVAVEHLARILDVSGDVTISGR